MFPSASATPFEPSSSLNFAIYTDGVPSSVFYGCHPEHEVVQHIPDEAIDELFPPTAEELAEMEAAEDFVDQMAYISFIEEREGAARSSFAGFGKRWEARRQGGLIGKPHPPKVHHDDDSLSHGHSGSISSVDEASLVKYAPRHFEHTPRRAEKNRMLFSAPKKVRGMHGHGGYSFSHQPRKHY